MFTLVGVGAQGRAALYYLLTQTGEEVVSYDPCLNRDEPFFKKLWENYHDRWTHVFGKLDHMRLSKNENTVISSLQPEENLCLGDYCVCAGINFVDFGGDIKVSNHLIKLNRMAHTKRVTLVSDCGIAPGLASTIAGDAERLGWDGVHIYCGGMPLYPNKNAPSYHVRTFSSKGYIREYTGVYEFRRKGELCRDIAYPDNPSHINILGERYSMENTSGGLSISPYISNLKYLKYMTLRRNDAHWDFVRKMLAQKNSEEVFDDLVPVASPTNPDYILFAAKFLRSGCPTFNKIYVWEYDQKLGLTAMARATGYMGARVAELIAYGEAKFGAYTMHNFTADQILKDNFACPDFTLQYDETIYNNRTNVEFGGILSRDFPNHEIDLSNFKRDDC